MNDQETLLRAEERIDDLQLMNLRVIQSRNAFRFGLDSVLLSDFARVRKGSRVCDLGTGTGILPLLLYGRAGDLLCDAVEIQPDAAERAERSMRLNALEDKIRVYCRDLREIKDFLPHSAYDLVICNPPYSKEGASIPSPKPALRTARQEADCTLFDVAAAASWLLKSRARLSLMLPAARMADAFDTLRRFRLEPKRLRMVHANAARPARLALIEAMLDVNPGLIVEAPLLVKNPDGSDTEEIRRIYHQDVETQ